MLHTNTVKKKYDVTITMWMKDLPSENPVRCGFPVEASSDEEANLKVHSLVKEELEKRKDVLRYEVTVTEKEE